MSRIRIATRGSDLALTQAEHVAGRIRAELGLETELVVVKTTGDAIQDVSLAKIGGKGLFVKEIEEALLDDRADVAVHSAKDLPASLAPGLTLAAFPERVDPRDALVAREPGMTIVDLPEGARVGTGSTRRMALLRALRPDLELVPLRGNVPTRIAKIESESLAAVVLACAGLDRLGLSDRISERIAPERMLPAVCQGVLALETRRDDPRTADIAKLSDASLAPLARAERAFQKGLGGDCTIPLAGFAESTGDGGVRLRGLVASADGRRIARAASTGPVGAAEAIGREVADAVKADGGAEILAGLREGGAS